LADVMTDHAMDAAPRGASPSAGFTSILFPDGRPLEEVDEAPEPDFFRDLNLDQVFAAVCSDKEEYRLGPFFRLPLSDVSDIEWRQEIVRDLSRADIRGAIELFAASQRAMREALAKQEKAYHALEKQRWYLDAALNYCEGVLSLRSGLAAARPGSRGIAALLEYLADYTGSADFEQLVGRARATAAKLASIRYCLVIDGPRVEVRRDCERTDYGSAIEEAFADFASGEVEEQFDFPFNSGMSQVDEKVLELVARLHVDAFSDLERFTAEVLDFADPTMVQLDRELQFYIAFLDYLAPVEAAGLATSIPRLHKKREVDIASGFDLALAGKMIAGTGRPVTNDARLSGKERVLLVSGPNQGGKTTFARMFGQVHYLAALGLFVPASSASVPLFDELFTHFEREESPAGPGGKLKDDIVRVHAIVERATGNSLVIFNEIFTSTTVEDARRLSVAVAERMRHIGNIGLWVTFLDDLAALGPDFVSLVAEVPADDPSARTYKVVRRAPEGVAHALAVAERYGLTYDRIIERLRQ
jgi:DNA mismatch repair protein MutS